MTFTHQVIYVSPSFLLKKNPPFQRLQNHNCGLLPTLGISGTFVMAISSSNSFSPYKRFLQKTKLPGCWPLVNFGDLVIILDSNQRGFASKILMLFVFSFSCNKQNLVVCLKTKPMAFFSLLVEGSSSSNKPPLWVLEAAFFFWLKCWVVLPPKMQWVAKLDFEFFNFQFPVVFVFHMYFETFVSSAPQKSPWHLTLRKKKTGRFGFQLVLCFPISNLDPLFIKVHIAVSCSRVSFSGIANNAPPTPSVSPRFWPQGGRRGRSSEDHCLCQLQIHGDLGFTGYNLRAGKGKIQRWWELREISGEKNVCRC